MSAYSQGRIKEMNWQIIDLTTPRPQLNKNCKCEGTGQEIVFTIDKGEVVVFCPCVREHLNKRNKKIFGTVACPDHYTEYRRI
jgi:hypothetical protein